jgi:hypothetical protein
MYSLRLFVRDNDDGRLPFTHVSLSATNDDEAIELGRGQIAENMPPGCSFVQARVCRGEEVIWQSADAVS